MILNVYKEKGWTSHDVVAKLRGVLRTKKIGHAGTLDPLAEGVLVVLTGEDTKKQPEIMNLRKEYLAEIAFGVRSLTYDMEGPLSFSDNPVNLDEIKEKLGDLLQKYTGKFAQRVPAFSAVKVEGRKLYKKARAGQTNEDELPVKEVEVYDLELQKLEERSIGDKKLPVANLKITCAKGFYVRSLAHDLGEDLGTGGVIVSLIRTRVGDFTIEKAQKISQIAHTSLE